MRQPPKYQLAEEAITVWCITGMIMFMIVIMIAASITYLVFRFEWPRFIVGIAASVPLIELILHIIVLGREDTFLKCVSTRWVMNRFFLNIFEVTNTHST